jgi:glyoxylase-like metal-dependent hydrolase (beta-lactamase superfamily II)
MDNTLSRIKLYDLPDGISIYQFRELTADKSPLADCYLIAGAKNAILIDTLQDETHLYDAVKTLTGNMNIEDTDIIVLLTHAHHDHVGVDTQKFLDSHYRVYLSKKDSELAAQFGLCVKPDDLLDITNGSIFSVGGYSLEAVSMAGHTPGSFAFLERTHQHLYTGDSTGAGVFWMQIPGCLPLSVLKTSMDTLMDKVRNMKNLVILPGHRHQAKVHDLEFLEDVVFATGEIVAGRLKGERCEMDFHGRKIAYNRLSYKTTSDYCYREENIRQ